MKNKEHLTKEGLEKIIKLSSEMNTNRKFEDKYNYLKNSLNLDLNGNINFKLPEHWVQTFIDGEGLFYNYLGNLDSHLESSNKNVILDSSLEIAQGNHDVLILLSIKNFFIGGYIKPKYNITLINKCKNSRAVNRFILRDTKKIINFLDKYPMLTRKYLDYLDWKKIVELKNNGSHKTIEGLDLIKQIKSKMNSKR